MYPCYPRFHNSAIWGKKRKHDDDDQEPKGSIAPIIGAFTVQEGDLAAVKAVLQNKPVDIEAWLEKLSLEDLECLKQNVVKHSNAGVSDTAIRS